MYYDEGKDFEYLRTKEKEAALYYLYMMADGKVSESEEELFSILCKECEIGDKEKQDVISICGKYKDEEDILEVIKRERLENNIVGEFLFFDKKEAARLVWNLINLGYADGYYSEDEKEIVTYIAEKSLLDKGIVREFTDIADTMLALTKQKKWADSVMENPEEKRRKKKELSRDITKLSESVKIIIDEI